MHPHNGEDYAASKHCSGGYYLFKQDSSMNPCGCKMRGELCEALAYHALS